MKSSELNETATINNKGGPFLHNSLVEVTGTDLDLYYLPQNNLYIFLQ